ncbi:MAG: NADH-quinone oxidoreductase subunit C [Verrucomicrobiae bacterium]|nr:NADH-quinone oxidoreductase subunit C [Verrucomicrobiae bacterium]
MTLAEAVKKIEEKFLSDGLDETEFRGEITFSVVAERLHDIARFCRDELGFNMLLDVSSVDHFGEDPRFEMVYQLYSLSDHISLRLKCRLPELAPKIATVSDLWPTANWHEREVYDMMGITFEGHPDLRRILMWDGYPYFPLRKDFPLEGKPSEMPDVAFSDEAPLQGGPFVTVPSPGNTQVREPRHRSLEDAYQLQERFILEP